MGIPTLERRHTGWDIVFGALLVIAGIVILGNVAVATTVSVVFLGWMVLLAGAILVLGALVQIRSGGSWSMAFGGAILAVLGLFIVRNPEIGAATLTLLAGAMFLASGLARVFLSFQLSQARWPLVLSGVVSMALGLIVLLNMATATQTLLGILLGIQALLEGITLMVIGRTRLTERPVEGAGQPWDAEPA